MPQGTRNHAYVSFSLSSCEKRRWLTLLCDSLSLASTPPFDLSASAFETRPKPFSLSQSFRITSTTLRSRCRTTRCVASQVLTSRPIGPDPPCLPLLPARPSSQDQNLIRIFPTTATFISQAINAGGTVLVHCNGGIALAPAIVVGYVMWAQQVSWEDALRHTQQKRYCMSLNLVRLRLPSKIANFADDGLAAHFSQGFLNQLREYESFCRASLQLPQSSSMDSSSRPSKRSGDDISDDDDVGIAMDDGAAQTMDLSIDPATGRREHRPERRVQRLGP